MTLNTQTVGQPLTLQCTVTTVRGITSRVDIVWSTGDVVLNRTNHTSPTVMENSLLFSDIYVISQVNTTDDGREYQCEVVINTSPPVVATSNITLDVLGKHACSLFSVIIQNVCTVPLQYVSIINLLCSC